MQFTGRLTRINKDYMKFCGGGGGGGGNFFKECKNIIFNHIQGESKKFVDFVNKIKSTYAISLKLPYVCDQFNTNKHRKFQTNRLINVVSMAICLMHVSATRSTPRR